MLQTPHPSKRDALPQAAESYARDAFGVRLGLHDLTPSALPHFLVDRYRFWEGDLFGRRAIFMAAEDRTLGRIGDFIKHREIVQQRLNATLVVLLLEALPQPLRRRLMTEHIAFLSPGAQLYVPEALIDLRESPVGKITAPPDHLSPTAQVVVLGSLLGEPVDDTSLTSLADRFNVAVMSMSRALDELEALGLAEPRRIGRQRRLQLALQRHDLWRAAENRFQSPVRKLRLVRGPLPPADFPLAGESALACETMLAAPKVERRAAPASAWKRIVRHLDLQPAWTYDDDRTEVETWSYDPRVLAGPAPVVDALSLYLSLRHEPDERVSQAAEQLLERFPW